MKVTIEEFNLLLPRPYISPYTLQRKLNGSTDDILAKFSGLSTVMETYSFITIWKSLNCLCFFDRSTTLMMNFHYGQMRMLPNYVLNVQYIGVIWWLSRLNRSFIVFWQNAIINYEFDDLPKDFLLKRILDYQ